MKRQIRFLPEAEAELAGAIAWYEERGKGLGAALLRSVEAGISAIERHPELYPIVHATIRRAPLRRFPYSLLYELSGNDILIVACFHGRRDPQGWKERRQQ